MKNIFILIIVLLALSPGVAFGSNQKEISPGGSATMYGLEYDSFIIKDNVLKIFFIGHATLMLEYAGKVIHIDPVSSMTDYSKLPAADLIVITHQHGDHLEPAAIKKIKKEGTLIIADSESAKKLTEAKVMKNGDKQNLLAIEIEAVPAYNTTAGRSGFHPQGRDNGYIMSFDGFRVYIAGDSEDTPEMKGLKDIAVAFLPMNQPYTMLPEQVAAVARIMQPKVLYPYHFGETDTAKLVELLKDEKNIEVRIRKLK